MPPRATLRSPRRKAKGTGGWVGEKSQRPGALNSVFRGLTSRSYRGGGERLKGINARRATAARGFRPATVRTLRWD
jgi:hypothetical protein